MTLVTIDWAEYGSQSRARKEGWRECDPGVFVCEVVLQSGDQTARAERGQWATSERSSAGRERNSCA